MLHEEVETQRSQLSPVSSQKVAEPSPSVSHVYMSKSSDLPTTIRTSILLQTAIVQIFDSIGQPHPVRILLDSGAQLNIISQRLVQRLRLEKHSEMYRIGGIGKTNVVSHHHVTITIQSIHSDFTSTLKCHVLPEITNDLPSSKIDVTSWNLPSNIKLADPTFFQPGKIDVLMGIDLFYKVIEEGLIKLTDHRTMLQKTSLGWLVAGQPTTVNSPDTDTYHALHACAIEDQVARFWELESCQNQKGMSVEETTCEDHFLTTHTRNSTGRFVVRLPTKPDTLCKLGNSFPPAEKRLNQLLNRFQKNPELKQAYADFISEYIQLGHMEEIDLPSDDRPSYFLPHHSVLRPDSLTTKLRVVFDASCPSDTGVSLNDTLMVGPTVQDDLISIILRFRMSKYAIIADIEKMYRQILMHESDRPLQRILWKAEFNEPTRVYQLKTVTYGTSAAPYLATRCLKQLAKEGQQKYPIAAEVLNRDFYMDDLLTGVDDLEHGNILCFQLISLLESAGFLLHKWASNDAELLKNIPKNLQDEQTIVKLDETLKPIKTLGLKWDTNNDTFLIDAPQWQEIVYVTKRSVLSDTARLFDPLGMVGPVILLAKLFLQDLWKEQLTWDEPLSHEFQQRWVLIRNNMAQLHDLSVPRWVISTTKPERIELHGFCDASERAYGACIYVRTIVSDSFSSHLLISKSRVAPIGNSKKERKLSLPRLELCSAQLLAHLYQKVRTAMHSDIPSYFWSDSTIVLHWLASPSSRWKNFIANRVSDIQHLTSENWHHVPGTQNPADYISRGVNPDQLKDCHAWWNGPEWLTQSSHFWPTQPRSPDPLLNSDVLEERVTLISQPLPPNEIFLLCSSYTKLQQRVAWIRRYLHNIKPANKEKKLKPYLSLQELNDATKVLVRIAQRESFADEFISLTKSGQVNPTSRLNALTPYLKDDLLHVGGRLRHANVSESRKHPLILPAGHPLTLLIADHYHRNLLHAGPQLLISSIREKFWPLRARNLARRVVHSCVRCFRCRPSTLEQLMGDLPRERVTPTMPFLRTGVDLCGPIFYKYPHRKAQPIKSYVAIFVCLVVKAVHIELVADLSTNAFLTALRRFVSRRGRPQLIECDNAKNFVGASRELVQLAKQFRDQQWQQTISNSCAKDGIDFKFIPPRSPNFGGLWEAAVKSFKTHLKPTIGNTILTYEELTTLLTQIESCLNSRPLTPLSSDPNDFEALTPAHFLIHRQQMNLAEPSYETLPTNRLNRYQLTQEFLRRLWKRWSTDYLSGLHPKTKWTRQRDNITIGTMVLVKEDNLPPLKWCLGRVINVIKGADDNIRVVLIKTKDGEFKRSISKICILPINESNTAEC